VAARPPAARVGEARLGDALIATGIPWKGHGDLARYGKILDAISPEVAGIRRFGSAALDLAWVAAGRFDGYFEEDVNLYDAAAGLLLVREAGGYVSDYRGGERMFERGEYLAAADGLHSKLLKLVGGALRA
jgi:myo-inositol-1(or 4)-monophosphatase